LSNRKYQKCNKRHISLCSGQGIDGPGEKGENDFIVVWMCSLNWRKKTTEFWQRNVLKDWAGWGDILRCICEK
jgi:hypothetical protein